MRWEGNHHYLCFVEGPPLVPVFGMALAVTTQVATVDRCGPAVRVNLPLSHRAFVGRKIPPTC
jgi:hypothetical protein